MQLQGSLTIFDWTLIIGYLLVTVGISLYSRFRSQRTATEYMTAGRSMNWIVVSIAVFATLFSTVSFVSAPGESYNYGCFILIFLVGEILVIPLAIWLFLRFFFTVPTFTAYEYLERRYSAPVRVFGAGLFLTTRLIYAGGVFYAASVMFERLLGWDPFWAILIIGTITIFYTVIGGIKGVIWADVVQTILLIIGIGTIVWKLLEVTGYSPLAVLRFAHEHDHTFELLFQKRFYEFDPQARFSIYVVVPHIIFASLILVSCDQLMIQRLLTSKTLSGAKRAVFSNYMLGIPVSLALHMIGLSLFYYYNTGGRSLPVGISGDGAFGYFIATQLPAPIPGLVIVALLSALMSTIAGVVNSLGTVFYNDILLKIHPKAAESGNEMRWCYFASLLFGILGICWALFLVTAAKGVKTTVLEIVQVWGGLWSLQLVGFLYAVTTRRISSKSIMATYIIVGIWQVIFPYVMYFKTPEDIRWGFWWLGLPGTIFALILPWLFSLLWPNRKDLTNLTLWTLDPELKKKLQENK